VSRRIDRRDFLRLSGAVAVLDATAMVAAPAVSTASPAAASRHAKRPSGLKLGCQSGPSDAQHFAFFARYGVRNICGSPVIADPERLCPTVAELGQLRELAEKYGLSVDMTDSVLLRSTLVDVEAHPAIVLRAAAIGTGGGEPAENLAIVERGTRQTLIRELRAERSSSRV
jgi:mannonate dehydratase